MLAVLAERARENALLGVDLLLEFAFSREDTGSQGTLPARCRHDLAVPASSTPFSVWNVEGLAFHSATEVQAKFAAVEHERRCSRLHSFTRLAFKTLKKSEIKEMSETSTLQAKREGGNVKPEAERRSRSNEKIRNQLNCVRSKPGRGGHKPSLR